MVSKRTIYYRFAISLLKKKKDVIDKFNKLNIKAPINIKEILKRLKTIEIEIITEFFNECKIDI